MRSFLCLGVLVCLALAVSATNELYEIELSQQFAQFEAKYNKQYSSQDERNYRLRVFRDNLQIVDQLNDDNGSPSFGVTRFMDLTKEEFRQKYLMSFPIDPNVLAPAPTTFVDVPNDIPPTMDWRDKNVVTPVKDQGDCGSCWAFSATEQIESMWALAGQPLRNLSVQQVVDCDMKSYMCGGGWPHSAYNYVLKAGGIESDEHYPYTAKDGKCVFEKPSIVAQLHNWTYVSNNHTGENLNMLNYVATKGPVSVCVVAEPWQFYKNGVLKSCPGNRIDHCVHLIGYTKKDDIDVWIVRNSWGTDWGEDGLIYVPRGKNMCHIAKVVTTVAPDTRHVPTYFH